MHKIDNIFHFVFGLKPQTEPFHLAHYLCIASCIKLNKPECVYFHYQYLPYGPWWDAIKDAVVLKKVEYPTFIDSFKYSDKQIEKFRYAHISDIVRLEVLNEYGGFYADIDTLFVNPIPEKFFRQKYILGKERVDENQKAGLAAGGSLCNAWIGSEKNAEFGRLWLDAIRKEFDGSWSAHSTFLPFKLSKQYPDLIHIEPERSFYHFDWTSEGINNIFTNTVADLENVYSIHLWSHLWWDPKRKDFTKFNNKRLTVNYLKFSKSTYASLARRFLPPDAGFSYAGYLKELLLY